jgi:signal transduction histidine kinase
MPEAQARELRELGHLISARAEELARREREALLASMRGAMLALIGFAAGVAVLGLVAGQVLSRVVVRPLRLLEQELQPIAAGHFNAFHAPSRDREIVSLTDALNRMLAELETRRLQVLQADKLASLGVLASGVAHELNNPLGNISTTAQIMSEELDSADPAAQRDWLNQIDTETERARRIVRTLLDYARRRDFHAEPVALEEVLDKSFLLLGKRRPAADAVRLDLEPDLVVEVDEQRMQQVFINLFRNALDAGATRLTVSARHALWADSRPGPGAPLAGAVAGLRDDRRLTVIRVADNGPGIPSAELARVFDPFFTTRAPGQGVGLGLYVAQEIVAEHGGCISAENPPGGGAVFTLCLPCPQSSGKPS